VRGAIVEDLELARRYRSGGLPVHCFLGGETVEFRMYPDGLAQLVEGWTKNLASGAVRADPVASALTVLWISAHLAVAVSVVRDLGRAVARSEPIPWATLVAAFVTSRQLRSLLARTGSYRPSTSAAFPIPLAAFVALFTRSVVGTFVRRRVVWRRREIALNRGRS
jgi:4,4'-diaponeurosporenoate glycosyltransferase